MLSLQLLRRDLPAQGHRRRDVMSDMSGMRFPSVKELRKKFEQPNLPQIAPNLRSYLNKAWAPRKESNPDLYEVYVGGRPHGTEDCWNGWDKKQATEFFNFLQQLDKKPLIQEYGWLPEIAGD